MSEGGEGRISQNLVMLLVFWFTIWFSARLAAITRLSPLLFYLLFGCLAGNMTITAMDLHHSAFLKTFSVLAISIVFYALGLEENVGHFISGIKKAWGIALIGALVPFAVGYGCTAMFWPESGFEVALMGGLAVTATAVSLTMIALKQEGLANAPATIGIMTSAVLDDIGSLAFVAICVPIATGEAAPSILGICGIMAKAGGFFLLVAFVHLVIMPHETTFGPLKCCSGFLNLFGAKYMLEWKDGEMATLITLLIGMAWCVAAHIFGFHPAIGAYMGGLIMEESYFDTKDGGNTFHHVFHHIEVVAYQWMGPFFFLELGSTIEVDMEVLGNVALYTIIFYVLLFIGQFVSAAVAARYVPGGFDWAESIMIGFGMMGRAELFFVVLELCYVEHHIMTRDQLCTFAFVAMLMNISVPVTITLYKPVYCRWTGYIPFKGPAGSEHGNNDHGHGHAVKDAETGHGAHHDHADPIKDHRAKAVDKSMEDIDCDIHSTTDTEDQDRYSNSDDSQSAPFENHKHDKKKKPNVMPMVCGCLTAEAGVPQQNNNRRVH
eukprot:TRINITY_DN39091_c0_g1_i1.p1 TRINITY_DN39091_c0_g1~~TRINITY_DN39091_c0_g1_i1.p1  ORF type:complete len:573 (+),score=123.43 TRINITY_DN39091_c0_g1_i1:74-1720(+)